MHDTVGILQASNDTVTFASFPHLVKAGMLGQISSEEHSCLNVMVFYVLYDIVPIHAFAAGDEEPEPTGGGVLACLGQNQLVLGSNEGIF